MTGIGSMGISSVGNMAAPFNRLVEDNKAFEELDVVNVAPFE